MERPAIPRPLRREILIEAGHRCAIPTCKQPTIEIAHIIPWAKCKEHTFDNLIALCRNCHGRFDDHQITQKEMQIYKANLSIVNSRYGDFEQRILRIFSEHDRWEKIRLISGFDILLMYLLQDGLLVKTGDNCSVYNISGEVSHEMYAITKKGREFIKKWISADELE